MRLIVVVVVFALVTLPLMPLQWLAVALKSPLRRRIGSSITVSSVACSASGCT